MKPLAPHIADLRAVIQLASQATAGVTGIVEGVHQSIWSSLGFAAAQPGRARGITGLVYRSIDAVNRGVSGVADGALGVLQQLSAPPEEGPGPPSHRREALLAALNGVLGDHLAATGNPLALPMTLRYRGQALDWQAQPPEQPGGKLLLMIHGLCMNDLQWQAQHDGVPVDHGQALAATHGHTPIYLRYNSGLHISENGRELSAQLERLVAHWPVPVKEITLLGHSMGGLVARSAAHYAGLEESRWLGHLRRLVFLGTPHHGAPLERAGNWIDAALGSTPFSAPIARLGQLRSAGITDLRYGHLVDEDWQGHHRFHRSEDRRIHVPLPPQVSCYSVAATTAAQRGTLAERVFGDGLVPLHSALGHHDDPQRVLRVPKRSQWIGYRMNHMELLRRPEVGTQLLRWLGPDGAGTDPAEPGESGRGKRAIRARASGRRPRDQG
jgi:pimeloyl-ACP methyl ester carboxylesterase